MGLGGEELCPGRPATSWCRVEAGFDQDVADGAGGDAVSEAEQLCGDALGAPAGVLRCQS